MSKIVDHPRQVARHFGRNIRTIQRWLLAGMPRLAGGLFDVDEIETWLQQKKPIAELEAKPRELEYLAQPVAAEVEALFGAGVTGLRQGFKTLFRALLLGGYRGDAARQVALQVVINLLLEEMSGV